MCYLHVSHLIHISKYLPGRGRGRTSRDQLSRVAGKVPTNHQCACVYEFQTAGHLVFQKYCVICKPMTKAQLLLMIEIGSKDDR